VKKLQEFNSKISNGGVDGIKSMISQLLMYREMSKYRFSGNQFISKEWF